MTPTARTQSGTALAPDECRRLLALGDGGRCRVAYNAHCLPAIAATTYRLEAGALVVTAGPWGSHAAGNVVAVEVDGDGPSGRWSVLVQGSASEDPAGGRLRVSTELVTGWVSPIAP